MRIWGNESVVTGTGCGRKGNLQENFDPDQLYTLNPPISQWIQNGHPGPKNLWAFRRLQADWAPQFATWQCRVSRTRSSYHEIPCFQKRWSTFCPTSSSLKKNPAPRSSSLTISSSTITNFPIPAKTIFFIASVATPRRFTTRMAAFLILGIRQEDPHTIWTNAIYLCWASIPQSLICLSYRVASSSVSDVFDWLPGCIIHYCGLVNFVWHWQDLGIPGRGDCITNTEVKRVWNDGEGTNIC